MKNLLPSGVLTVCLLAPVLYTAEVPTVAQAQAAVRRGNLWEATRLLQLILKAKRHAEQIRTQLYSLNRRLYLTPLAPPGTRFWRVVRGDTLARIARKFSITPGLLRRINALRGDNLRVGQKLKVLHGPFDARVVKASFTLQVLHKGKVLFTYPVGLGRNNCTPTGTFTVGARLRNPTQFDRDTGRVYRYGEAGHTLGTRWITFSGPYGIHGTVDPSSIGKEASEGCVRMLNHDVEELFDLLATGRSKIIIVQALPGVRRSAPSNSSSAPAGTRKRNATS